jgi:hypothetical protein
VAGIAAGVSAESVGKHLVQTFGIEADHHLAVHNNGGSGAAVVFADQLKNGLLVYAYVLDFKLDTFLRKVALCPGARRSAGLAVDHYLLSLHSLPSLRLLPEILPASPRFIFFDAPAQPCWRVEFPW